MVWKSRIYYQKKFVNSKKRIFRIFPYFINLKHFVISNKQLKSLKKIIASKQIAKFAQFEAQLKNNEAEIWIDGANVGYFSQKQSNFSLFQLHSVYNHFANYYKTIIVLSQARLN